MRITLTGRRLALAAVLVLGGVAAPLAYATIGNAGKAGNAPAQKPTKIVTPLVQAGKTVTGAASAPTAVGDPYQATFYFQSSGGEACQTINPPAGSPFVLESVELVTNSRPGNPGVANWFTISPLYKRVAGQPDGLQHFSYYGFNLPADAQGDGQLFFNLLVRPNTVGNAAIGDIYSFFVCISSPGSVQYLIILTGKSASASGPTPAQVSLFDATSGKAGLTLRWTTGSETGILGFNVWRYRAGKGVKVNRSLIRAKRSGEPAGAGYSFMDSVPGAKRGLTYRLQLVDLKGRRSWYAAFAIAS